MLMFIKNLLRVISFIVYFLCITRNLCVVYGACNVITRHHKNWKCRIERNSKCKPSYLCYLATAAYKQQWWKSNWCESFWLLLLGIATALLMWHSFFFTSSAVYDKTLHGQYKLLFFVSFVCSNNIFNISVVTHIAAVAVSGLFRAEITQLGGNYEYVLETNIHLNILVS